MAEPCVVLGAGGHAAVLLEVLADLAVEVRAVVSPGAVPARAVFAGIPWIADDEAVREAFAPGEIRLVNGVGSLPGNDSRTAIFERFRSWGYTFASVLSPRAVISRSATVGEGVQIMAGAIVQSGARLADDTIVNTGAIVDHDCDLGAHTHVAPGATLSGGVRTGIGVHIGTGASVIQGIVIGDGAVVGAGAVVVRDLAPGARLLPAAQRLETGWARHE